MTGRFLRVELRRSAAGGIALLMLVVGTAMLLSSTQFFAGRWMQLAVNTRSMLMVLLPLALAGGAWLGRRETRHRVDELFASTVRPRWHRVVPTAGALAIAVVTAYVLVFLIAAGWVVPTSEYFPTNAIVVTSVGALSLVAAGWLGMAAGRAVPRVITAPVLAVVGFALVGLAPELVMTPDLNAEIARFRPEPSAVLLVPVFSGGVDDLQTIVTRISLLQTLWLVALATTGLLLLSAVGRRATALAVLPAVLGAAVAVPLLPAGGTRAAAAVDPVAAELVCDTGGPQVCVTRVHAGILPDVVGPARQALNMVAAKLPNAPTRAVQSQQVAYWAQLVPDSSLPRHQADTIVFDTPTIGRTGRAELSADFLPSLLLAPWEQECGEGSDLDEAYLAQVVAAAWLSGQPPTPPPGWEPAETEQAKTAYEALVGLPEAEQQRRMAAARDAAMDCRADGLLAILPEEKS
ncbi:hypothetical protein [Micromonospora sp. NPDC004704]